MLWLFCGLSWMPRVVSKVSLIWMVGSSTSLSLYDLWDFHSALSSPVTSLSQALWSLTLHMIILVFGQRFKRTPVHILSFLLCVPPSFLEFLPVHPIYLNILKFLSLPPQLSLITMLCCAPHFFTRKCPGKTWGLPLVFPFPQGS